MTPGRGREVPGAGRQGRGIHLWTDSRTLRDWLTGGSPPWGHPQFRSPRPLYHMEDQAQGGEAPGVGRAEWAAGVSEGPA